MGDDEVRLQQLVAMPPDSPPPEVMLSAGGNSSPPREGPRPVVIHDGTHLNDLLGMADLARLRASPANPMVWEIKSIETASLYDTAILLSQCRQAQLAATSHQISRKLVRAHPPPLARVAAEQTPPSVVAPAASQPNSLPPRSTVAPAAFARSVAPTEPSLFGPAPNEMSFEDEVRLVAFASSTMNLDFRALRREALRCRLQPGEMQDLLYHRRRLQNRDSKRRNKRRVINLRAAAPAASPAAAPAAASPAEGIAPAPTPAAAHAPAIR